MKRGASAPPRSRPVDPTGDGPDGPPGAPAAPPVEAEPDLVRCIEVLEAIAGDRSLLARAPADVRRRLLEAAGLVSRPGKAERKRLAKAFRRRDRDGDRRHDEGLLDRTGMREARQAPVFQAPAPRLPAALPPPGPATPAGPPTDATLPGPPTPQRQQAPQQPQQQPQLQPPQQPQQQPQLQPPPPPQQPQGAARTLRRPRACYVCKRSYERLHHFYDSLCPECGDLNYAKRFQTAPLTGRVALVTGGRLKIGYHAALMLLRAGARVIVTTRFPVDAAARFARAPDHDAWADRLRVHGLDLRHTPSVELFARHLLGREERLDVLINNAAQTVRRPPAFYAHLLPAEETPFERLPPALRPLLAAHEELRACLATGPGDAAGPAGPAGASSAHELVSWRGGASGIGLLAPARLSQIACAPGDDEGDELFPGDRRDPDLQPIDLRAMNSWRLPLGDVPTPELLEVHLVNAIAPFILNSRLKPLLRRGSPPQGGADWRHIVNVSAMEAQFSRRKKTDKHPHTNMAKAALNMMTRTSAADYARDGIYMNSVDTGWVTDEDPLHHVARKERVHGFHPPLDIVDGAARVCDPVFAGVLTGRHEHGRFFKDYRPVDW